MSKEKVNNKIRIELIRSVIGSLPKQRATVKALGLNKLHSRVEIDMTPQIKGMLNVVNHLVRVEGLN